MTAFHLRAILVLLGVAQSRSTPFESITFGPDALPGLVIGQKGASAVIVIQEWWGVTDNIISHAAKINLLSRYRVLVPDLYKGELGANAEEAHHLMTKLDFTKAITEISQAAAFLKEEGSPKVAVVGMCMGGALALGALAASDDLDCGATFYGVNFDLFNASTQLQTKPVQAHFGELDTMEHFSDPATAAMLEEELKAAGNNNVEIYSYSEVGHAFLNESPAPWKTFDERQKAIGFPPYQQSRAYLAIGRLTHFLKDHIEDERKDEL